ncbi:MAG: YncE family protein [Gemmatimonadales bacterium]
MASSGVDQIALLRFGPRGGIVEHRTTVKLVPGEPESPPDIYVASDGKSHQLTSARGLPDSELATGPQYLAVGPDHRTYYITTVHGFGGGELLRVRIAADSSSRESQPPDTVTGREPLGAVPGAVAITPDGQYAWVANAVPLHGGSEGWIGVVYLPSMVEVARIRTCGHPAGSRLVADGSRQYSVCTTADTLVEIGTHDMQVSRRIALDGERGRCAPTWVETTADGSRIYVTCSGTGEIVEVNGTEWKVSRRFPVGAGVNHLALTHDGKLLVATNSTSGEIVAIELASGRELSRLHAQHAGPGEVVVSGDDRYGFIAVAGRPGEVGSVEVVELATFTRVATIDVGGGAAGIGFWKMQ